MLTELARRTDPISSQLAGEAIADSDLRRSQQAQTVRLVHSWPGATSRELAEKSGLDRYVLARRLPEVERQGLIQRGPFKRCEISGRPALTWWPKERQKELF